MTTTLRLLTAAVVAGVALAAAIGFRGAREDGRIAEGARQSLATERPAPQRFDASMLAGLPAIAQRYFEAAIAPGTPLYRSATLEMEGTFILGGREMAMRADQILAPPNGFVWRARIGGGLMRFDGSDGYLAGETSWTRFRMFGLVPVARIGDTEDHARAAAARMVTEAVWVPATLLPDAGAVWRELGPERAEVRFPAVEGVEAVELTIDAEGRLVEFVTLRWSDANEDGTYRLQPFGGRMLAHDTHQGFTIPTAMEVGNHYGTDAYAPFFRAQLTSVRFPADRGSEGRSR
jgi:hypothetical protein